MQCPIPPLLQFKSWLKETGISFWLLILAIAKTAITSFSVLEGHTTELLVQFVLVASIPKAAIDYNHR